MNRRKTLKALGGAALAGAAGLTSRIAFAAAPTMVTVVKIAGIPWFNAVEKGIKKGGWEWSQPPFSFLSLRAERSSPAGSPRRCAPRDDD